MRLQALNQQTEKLPLVELDVEVDLIGKNTKQCIQSGVINGVLLEIDGMINRYKKPIFMVESNTNRRRFSIV